MTEIESCIWYYGFINTEFVQWGLADGGHLVICTLPGNYVYIGREKWHHKRGILGPGKIEFKLPYGGQVYLLALKMNPIRERDANEALFRSGRNGVLNLSSRAFSSIFRPEHEQIDPDQVWPFSVPQNDLARGVAKTAIAMAIGARSRESLAITRAALRDGTFAWMEVFCAIGTYAIMSNGLTKTDESDRMSVHRALPNEFCALGFFTGYQVFFELGQLLIEMKNSSGLIDVQVLGEWALRKAGYGSTAYPRERAVDENRASIGGELRDYLAVSALAIADMEDSGEANWAAE